MLMIARVGINAALAVAEACYAGQIVIVDHEVLLVLVIATVKDRPTVHLSLHWARCRPRNVGYEGGSKKYDCRKVPQ